MNTQQYISIVIPAFNEETNLEAIYAALTKALGSLDAKWEVIFTDDGSSDGTWEKIQELNKSDSKIKGVRLSRNFGHQYAILAGLSKAEGDAVVMMDGDLQHPPEVIPRLVDEWRAGNKIVNTIRLDSDNLSVFKKLTSRLFYRTFSFLCGVKLKNGMADFRLLDRQVVENLLKFREDGLFLRGLVQWVGYQNSTIEFKSHDRFSGTSKYTIRKMIRFAFNGITSFSLMPLRITIIVGIVTSSAAFAEMIYAIYVKLFTNTAVPGWASATAVISFLFGILFILLGVIGDYIGRILVEVKNRPRFIISEQTGAQQSLPVDTVKPELPVE